MWTVFLVEDEETVRERVRKLIPWEQHGFRLVGEAGDGEEAYEQIMQLKPNLVICDVVMPVMDGIELLQKVRQAGLDSQFVMLTCMNEFEYARQALEYGAFGYVLKLSMTVQHMVSLLSKVKEKLDERENLQDQLILGKFIQFYEAVWEQIWSNEKTSVSPPIPVFPDKTIHNVQIIATIRNGDSPKSVHRMPWEQRSGSSPYMHIHQFSKLGITTWFLWLHSSHQDADSLHLDAWKNELPSAAYSQPTSAKQLQNQWSAVLRGLDNFWYERSSGFLICDKSLPRTNSYQSIAWPQERELFQVFEDMKIAEFEQLLHGIWSSMEQADVPVVWVKQTAVRLHHTLVRIANRTKPENMRLAGINTHSELLHWLSAQGERYLLEQIDEQSHFTDHPVINKIIQYIRSHYHTAITLESMAKYSSMDKNYLSGLFKRKTDETLIHYVQKTRLEHAARLLANTDLSLGEIAERVGFASDNYFIKMFKRWYIVTPAEYKRIHAP
jgi:two-component system response regulator YesN